MLGPWYVLWAVQCGLWTEVACACFRSCIRIDHLFAVGVVHTTPDPVVQLVPAPVSVPPTSIVVVMSSLSKFRLSSGGSDEQGGKASPGPAWNFARTWSIRLKIPHFFSNSRAP